jgi:hypothetical protein
MKTPIMTSFTREKIAYSDVCKIAPAVLSVGLPRGRNEYKLIPYEQIIECNERANLIIKPVANDMFICLINGNKLDSQRHHTEVEARLHHWHMATQQKSKPHVKATPKRTSQKVAVH